VLFFVKEVVKLDSEIAGFVMLSGQIADGIMTPIVGILSDKFDTRCGKRTPWYIFGTLLVLPTFLGIFIQPNF
jgi:Na+/melibiose symporter-like transporter